MWGRYGRSRSISARASSSSPEHPTNISFERACEIVGKETAERVRKISLEIYQTGLDYAETKGLILADTKFEFGYLGNELILIDEVLTPDSSRFWPKDQYQVGMSPPSYDKQYVRDYLESLTWDKTPPAPKLPEDVIARTSL